MREAMFTLGREGKRYLERQGGTAVGLERRPPKQCEHLLGINDLRIAAEASGALEYFFASWELPGVGWRHPVIPDAVFCVGKRTFAAEYDRGLETLRYFVRTKIAVYARGLQDFPLTAVVVVADRSVRMKSLARSITGARVTVFFTTIDLVRDRGILAPIFYRHPDGRAETIV